MAVARHPRGRPAKKERVAAHVEELKRLIRSAYPEARFELAPVPGSKWPGLWVYARFDSVWDVLDLVADVGADFLGQELTGVHVIPMELTGSDD